MVFYRFAFKPIQALPVMEMGPDKKYGITSEESVIFSGFHTGESFYIVASKLDVNRAEAEMSRSFCFLIWKRQGHLDFTISQ